MTPKRSVECPKCTAKLTMAADSTAARLRCAKCSAIFTVPNVTAPAPPHAAPPQPAAGWYPEPNGGTAQRYWDGTRWTVTAAPSPPTASTTGKKAAVAAGVCVLVVIGIIMTLQPVSLISGSGIIWTGVAMTTGGTAVAFFLGGPIWVRVIACLALGFTLLGAFYTEHEMSVRRDELSNIFSR